MVKSTCALFCGKGCRSFPDLLPFRAITCFPGPTTSASARAAVVGLREQRCVRSGWLAGYSGGLAGDLKDSRRLTVFRPFFPVKYNSVLFPFVVSLLLCVSTREHPAVGCSIDDGDGCEPFCYYTAAATPILLLASKVVSSSVAEPNMTPFELVLEK